jgi:hypothetical protein
MTRRLAFTPAIGLFTGLSMVSFGAVSMFLTGVHGSSLQASNACSTSATAAQAPAATQAGTAHSGAMYLHGALWQAPADTQAPATTPAVPYAPAAAHIVAAHTAAFAARSWRPGSGAPARAAQHPVLLDVAAQRISAGQGAQHHSADAAATATTQTTPPAPPTGSPGPVNPPPPTPDPSPGGGNVTPSPGTGAPSPDSTGNNTPGSHGAPTPPVSPGGSDKTPTASPSSSATTTPTPTSTPTTTPPPAATLCLSVQTLGGSNTVKPETSVHFAIWVWLTSGKSGTATITVDASPSRVKPSFSVCQPTGGTTCSVSGLQAGDHVETQARLYAAKDLAGRDITLTVTATSHQAANKASATDKIEVAKRSRKHSSSSPTPTPNAGDGAGYPPASYPGGNAGYPGVTNPTGNLGSDFPQVSPSPNISPATSPSRRQHQIEVTDLSAGLPLDVRLIGGQVVGLAILAAAVTIAVARLSLRRQPAKHSDEGSGS